MGWVARVGQGRVGWCGRGGAGKAGLRRVWERKGEEGGERRRRQGRTGQGRAGRTLSQLLGSIPGCMPCIAGWAGRGRAEWMGPAGCDYVSRLGRGLSVCVIGVPVLPAAGRWDPDGRRVQRRDAALYRRLADRLLPPPDTSSRGKHQRWGVPSTAEGRPARWVLREYCGNTEWVVREYWGCTEGLLREYWHL